MDCFHVFIRGLQRPSLPADVLWGSFVRHSFLPQKWMRDERTPKDICGKASRDQLLLCRFGGYWSHHQHTCLWLLFSLKRLGDPWSVQQLVHHNVWNLAIGQDKICCVALCCACGAEWTVQYYSCHIYYPIHPLISWVTNYSLILAWNFSYGNVLYVSVPRWHQGFKIVWIFRWHGI